MEKQSVKTESSSNSSSDDSDSDYEVKSEFIKSDSAGDDSDESPMMVPRQKRKTMKWRDSSILASK